MYKTSGTDEILAELTKIGGKPLPDNVIRYNKILQINGRKQQSYQYTRRKIKLNLSTIEASTQFQPLIKL